MIHQQKQSAIDQHLLVEGRGVSVAGCDSNVVGIAGSLQVVLAIGELELVGSLEVGVSGLVAGASIVLKIENLKLADNCKCCNTCTYKGRQKQ